MKENKEFESVVSKADELISIDFSNSPESYNHNEYYDAISKIANKNSNLKQEEAENIISDIAVNFVNKEFILELEKRKETIHNYIRKYDPNGSIIADMKVHDVDKVYSMFNYLLNSYIQYLNDMSFDFQLSNQEFKFLDKVLTRTIEYNGDDVFNYVEFIENFWESAKEEFENDKTKETYTFKINIKKILLLHHLIKGHKVKGITTEFKLFRNVLYRIAQTNRVFNAYNIIVERLKDDAKLWGNALDAVLSPKEVAEGLEKTEDKNVILPVTDKDLGK